MVKSPLLDPTKHGSVGYFKSPVRFKLSSKCHERFFYQSVGIFLEDLEELFEATTCMSQYLKVGLNYQMRNFCDLSRNFAEVNSKF